MNDSAAYDSLVPRPDDDGLLFVIPVLSSGEERATATRRSTGASYGFRCSMILSGRATTLDGCMLEGMPSQCAACLTYRPLSRAADCSRPSGAYADEKSPGIAGAITVAC